MKDTHPEYTKSWSCINDLLLKAHYENETWHTMSLLTGRSTEKNYLRARKLGLKTSKIRNLWSKKMEDYFRANYKKMTYYELSVEFSKLFPRADGKKWEETNAIKGYIQRNKLSRTPEELRALTSKMMKKLWGSDFFKNTNIYRRQKRVGEIIEMDLGYGVQQYIIKKKGYTLFKNKVYEDFFGPIPEGYFVQLIDGDYKNVVPENLVLKTKSYGLVKATKELNDNFVIWNILKQMKISKEEKKELAEMIRESDPLLIEVFRNEMLLNRKFDEQKENQKLAGNNTANG